MVSSKESVGHVSLAQVDGLTNWARYHGAHLLESVEIYNDPKFGVALRVRSAQESKGDLTSSKPSSADGGSLSPGSRIVSCPFTISLSYLNALDIFSSLEAHSPPFPALFLEESEPHVIGHFFLMQQYLDVENSHWGPYVKSLPQPDEPERLGTPLYFTEADLAWIRGTNLEAARDHREQTWKSDWRRSSRKLDSAAGWEMWRGKWTWNLYKWAATIFSSRSFTSTLIPDEIFTEPQVKIDKDSTYSHQEIAEGLGSSQINQTNKAKILRGTLFPVLFPLVDLANHSSTAKVTWFTNVTTEPKDLSIIIDSEISLGCQIFNNYAPKNNTELLLGYGFCIPGNDEISIAFRPLGDEDLAIRQRQLCYQNLHHLDGNQHIFHVRASPYVRPLKDDKLLVFTLFEDGCVDVLAVLVANSREKDFMMKYPGYCPKRSSETVFVGLLSRNIFNVMSVLLEKLKELLDQITSHTKHLGSPTNSRQHVAKIYRDGQISTLQAAINPLQAQLHATTSRHTICNHQDLTRPTSPSCVEMEINAELITLDCAFSWLQKSHPQVYEQSISIISKELDVVAEPTLDWIELIANDWDFTLWCFWIYVVLAFHLTGDENNSHEDAVSRWIESMLSCYNHDATYSVRVFNEFFGDADEAETLKEMIFQLDTITQHDLRTLDLLHGLKEARCKFMNFASALAKEEGVIIGLRPENWNGRDGFNQRVLCLSKMPTSAIINDNLGNPSSSGYPNYTDDELMLMD